MLKVNRPVRDVAGAKVPGLSIGAADNRHGAFDRPSARCALVHPFYFAGHPDAARTSEVGDFVGQPVVNLHALTLRDLPAAVR
jgi:hypothetical protein